MTDESTGRAQRYLVNAGSLAIVMLLGAFVWRTQQLRQALNTARRDALMPRPSLWVPEVDVYDALGRQVTLGKQGQRQVLVYLQSTCEYCRQSVAHFNKLADALTTASRSTVPVYGVQLDTVVTQADYASGHGFRFPIVRFRSLRDSRVYAARATPFVVVVDTSGRISYARSGALQDDLAIDSIVRVALLGGGVTVAATSAPDAGYPPP